MFGHILVINDYYYFRLALAFKITVQQLFKNYYFGDYSVGYYL